MTKRKPSIRIKKNAWDNWYGYIGTKRVAAFCNSTTQTQEQQAKEWLEMQNKNWAPWQLSPDSDPQERWILVNADDDREEHPANVIFPTQEDALKSLMGERW